MADALKHGAKVVLGGKRHARGGNFYEPTILANVTQAMMVAREETFGPVAPLFKFKTEADVIAMANDTPFGLAAYFYARDVGRVWRVGRGAGVRHHRHQRGHHIQRGGAVRRLQAVGPRPRGLPPRRRGVPRDQVHADGWAVTVRASASPPHHAGGVSSHDVGRG